MPYDHIPAGSVKVPTLFDEVREFKRFERKRKLNWWGIVFFIFYICAFIFYMYVRIAKTLNLGRYLA